MKYRKLSSIYFEDKNEYEKLYRQRFESESSYKFDLKIAGNQAFVMLNTELIEKLDRIRKLDKKLTESVSELPSIALTQYTRRCLVDEIRLTNDIEGVVSTRKEINEILNDIQGKKKGQRLYGLVKKYELLLKEEIKLEDCYDIKNIYESLVLKEVVNENPNNRPDGEIFRKDKVYVKNPEGRTIHTGLYPEELIIETLRQGLNIINDESYNPLISIAVFHYVFGYVHPYYDGNGRTSRFISSYLLAKELHPLVSYRISHTIKENINAYYKSFKITNDPNSMAELTYFVDEFLSILETSLDELCITISEKKKQLQYFESLIKMLNVNDERAQVIQNVLLQNSLFGETGLDILSICKITSIGNSKVREVIKILEVSEFLKVGKEGKKKVYDIDFDVLNRFRSQQ